MPDLTIVITTFNRYVYLTELISSILKLQKNDTELIIVNNGSNDRTASLLKRLKTKTDFDLISIPENIRYTKARNLGLEKVNTEYVMFIDDDDLLLPHKIENTLITFRKSSADLVCGACIAFKDDLALEIYKAKNKSSFMREIDIYKKNPIQWASVAFRTSALRDTGGFPEDFALIPDWVLFRKFIKRHSIYYTDEVLGLYRLHDTNFSLDTDFLAEDVQKAQRLGFDLRHFLIKAKVSRAICRNEFLSYDKVPINISLLIITNIMIFLGVAKLLRKCWSSENRHENIDITKFIQAVKLDAKCLRNL